MDPKNLGDLVDLVDLVGLWVRAILWVRWDLARHEAASVGAGMENYHTLATRLLRATGVTGDQLVQILQPNLGRMPQNQIQYDEFVNRLRQMGHILERCQGHLMSGLHRDRAGQQTYTTDVLYGNASQSDSSTP